MVTVQFLPADAADDPEVVKRIVDLVNFSYTTAEADLWTKPLPRTHDIETRAAIADQALAVAERDGEWIGAIQTKRLNESTWWFGALAVHPEVGGLGVGAKLVQFAETTAVANGTSTIQLERLDPVDPIAYLERLHSWYDRLGYVEVKRYEVGLDYPEDAKFLTCPCDLVIMRKPLTPVG